MITANVLAVVLTLSILFIAGQKLYAEAEAERERKARLDSLVKAYGEDAGERLFEIQEKYDKLAREMDEVVPELGRLRLQARVLKVIAVMCICMALLV